MTSIKINELLLYTLMRKSIFIKSLEMEDASMQ